MVSCCNFAKLDRLSDQEKTAADGHIRATGDHSRLTRSFTGSFRVWSSDVIFSLVFRGPAAGHATRAAKGCVTARGSDFFFSHLSAQASHRDDVMVVRFSSGRKSSTALNFSTWLNHNSKHAQIGKQKRPPAWEAFQVQQWSILQPLLLRPIRVLARIHDRRGDCLPRCTNTSFLRPLYWATPYLLWTLLTRRHRRFFRQRARSGAG